MIIVEKKEELENIPPIYIQEESYVWCIEPPHWYKNKDEENPGPPDIIWNEASKWWIFRPGCEMATKTTIQPKTIYTMRLSTKEAEQILNELPDQDWKTFLTGKSNEGYPIYETGILENNVGCCLGRDIIEKHLTVKGEQMNGSTEGNMGLNMGNDANAGMCRDDSSTSTRLLDKNWSPLIVRKYQMEGWPLYIAIICDANLNDLDEVVYRLTAEAREHGFMDGKIQSVRNYCGFMSDGLVKHYNKVKTGVMEGNLIAWYVDKCFVSSAYGDMMTHYKCAAEVYAIINTLPHI